jgi:hypothetical protein
MHHVAPSLRVPSCPIQDRPSYAVGLRISHSGMLNVGFEFYFGLRLLIHIRSLDSDSKLSYIAQPSLRCLCCTDEEPALTWCQRPYNNDRRNLPQFIVRSWWSCIELFSDSRGIAYTSARISTSTQLNVSEQELLLYSFVHSVVVAIKLRVGIGIGTCKHKSSGSEVNLLPDISTPARGFRLLSSPVPHTRLGPNISISTPTPNTTTRLHQTTPPRQTCTF